MPLRPRTGALETFSTFVQFVDDRFEAWMVDPRLLRSMKEHSSQKPLESSYSSQRQQDSQRQSEEFWVLLWYQKWQRKESSQAFMHLCAYLQEPCYWAAENVTRRFVSVQYTLADGFQVAIARLEHILAHYSPTHGSSLKSYARTAFGNIIRNRLRQHKAVNICSDWGLLRRLSQTQLNKALQQAGFTQTASDILIWQCFKAVYTPDAEHIANATVNKLQPPSVEQLDNIATRYNRQRTQHSPSLASIDSKAAMESLKRSAQAVRSQLNPTITSLNRPQYYEDQESMDSLSADDTPMDQLLAAEAYAAQQQKMQAIASVLIEAIARLAPSMQTLLRLYYEQNLTQKDIANRLHIKQYQVSRQLSRVRQQLLISVATWSQDKLHISIDSDVLANMSDLVHEWLQRHYAASTNAPNSIDPQLTSPDTAVLASNLQKPDLSEIALPKELS
ncbi:sigma-70 family RNA polymerase sigma factor [cf. Phormidesmis sp. LEGE 11477]|uniref:sigma-70 family RNA polymerase sigma factor n=1 Tax=cf. Phormidesmis sp. LEGE 11477 TaxID=1828680 RepID=UPI00187FA4D3|nr:sigma-70 family RNA polymerase sigma factor [cf. Phormidesmis sp. LEGE 11477]MBE9063763.1 sigma-70 family RNA polymerase sigma factor [cf. Phormidesmis sp. LEGE 11477]